MEHQGNGVEPVTLVGDATLTISPVGDQGLVIVHNPDLGLSPNLLAADDGVNDNGPIQLVRGESYAYLNTGDGPFIVRDDSFPDFKPDYEIPSTVPELLRALAELGMQVDGE